MPRVLASRLGPREIVESRIAGRPSRRRRSRRPPRDVAQALSASRHRRRARWPSRSTTKSAVACALLPSDAMSRYDPGRCRRRRVVATSGPAKSPGQARTVDALRCPSAASSAIGSSRRWPSPGPRRQPTRTSRRCTSTAIARRASRRRSDVSVQWRGRGLRRGGDDLRARPRRTRSGRHAIAPAVERAAHDERGPDPTGAPRRSAGRLTRRSAPRAGRCLIAR